MNNKWRVFFFLLLSICWAVPQYGQYGNIWLPIGFDFNVFPPIISDSTLNIYRSKYGSSLLDCLEANSTMCNQNGQLLFYTDGGRVFNRNLDIMPNGKKIISESDPAYVNPIRSTRQGTLIVPMINEDNLFYLFSLGGSTTGSDFSISKRLYYSIVDMRLDNGLGDVVVNKQGIFLNEPYAEGMICVPGNHCNVWLVVRSFYSGDFHAYKITEEGIDSSPVVSPVDVMPPSHVMSFNYSKQSNKFLLASDQNFTLLDFDPNTGRIGQPIHLIAVNNATTFNGFEFIAFDSSGQFIFYHDYWEKVSYRADITIYHPDSIKNSREVLPFISGGFILGPDNILYTNVGNNYGCVLNSADSIHRVQYLDLPSTRYTTHNIFSRPNQPIVKMSVNDPPISDYVAIENTSCFARGSTPIAIGPENPSKIKWSTGDTTEKINVYKPGKYWVRYLLSPCELHCDTFDVTYLYPPLPDPEIIASCFKQDNGIVRFPIAPDDSASYAFIWTNEMKDTLSTEFEINELPPGNYSVWIQRDTCDTIIKIAVPEITERVNWTLSDTLICVNDTLTVLMNSGYFYHALWMMNDSVFSTDPIYTIIHLPAGQHLLKLIASGERCIDTITQLIYVDAKEGISFTQDKEEICVGQSIAIDIPVKPQNLVGLLWQIGENRYQTDRVEGIITSFDQEGNTPIMLSASFRACPDTSYLNHILVHPIPIVDMGKDSVLCYNGTTIAIENKVKESGNYSYLWSTGDTTEGISVTHPGVYSLTVIAKPLNCINTESIEVKKGCYIDIPNAFTPNGDGYNDYFFPRQLLSDNVTAFKMQVFNRWGQIIFETTHKDGRGWDGRYNGKDQPQGSYVYKIEVSINEREETYSGNVTIIR